MSFEQTYAFKFLIYVDRFVGALIFRDSNITISSQCGLELRKENPALWAKLLGGTLNWIETDHCEKAIRYDAYYAHVTLQRLGFETGMIRLRVG
jgi:hypothetical protein